MLNMISVADATESLPTLRTGPCAHKKAHATWAAVCGLPTVRVSPLTGQNPSESRANVANDLSQILPASPPSLCLYLPLK